MIASHYSAVRIEGFTVTLFGCLAECGIVCVRGGGWCEYGLHVSQFEIA